MEGIQRAAELGPRPETWVPRLEKPISKDFYTLQYEFAKAMTEHKGMSLPEAINWFAPFINGHVFEKAEGSGLTLREGVTLENMADIAYDEDQQKVSKEPIQYHAGGTRYGCSMYTYDDEAHVANLHFVNAEYDDVGPLDNSKVGLRRQEISDVMEDLRAQHPEVQTIQGDSWLYNLKAYCRLFPKSYTERLIPQESFGNWVRGTTIWGQFIDSDGQVKKELADILLTRARSLSKDQSPTDLLAAPLLHPLKAEAPVEDFYREYGLV